MNSVVKDITAILKKAGVTFQSLPKDWDNANLEAIFHHMVPERICEFDAKCIGEAVHYVGVLAEFAQATLGEFVPGNPRTMGAVDGTVTLEFEHAGQTVRFKFKQEGHWVADAFYVQLRKFCKKHLSGNFLSVDTNVSTDVYLPHKAIAQIEKKTRSFASTDALLDFVLAGATDADLLRIRDRLPWQVPFGYTNSGESLLTALVKSGANMDTFMTAFHAFGCGLPNRYGESSLELVERLHGIDLIPGYYGDGRETMGYAEIREKWGERLWHNNKPEYMCIINELGADLASMRFPATENLFEVSLCHAPVFKSWVDAAELRYFGAGNVYILDLLTLGPGGGSLHREIPADQVDVVIDLLRRYCLRTLWVVPGRDGAWVPAE
jgi:hypothetical protein